MRHLERQPDGSRPAKDDGWTDVWAQLGGRTLSIWDMNLIAEANKEGREVPPTYVNMTDAVCYFLNNFYYDIHEFAMLVRSSARICHCTCVGYQPCQKIHRCINAQHGWIQPLFIFMPVDSSLIILGCGIALISMGEVSHRRDLHCSYASNYHSRWCVCFEL